MVPKDRTGVYLYFINCTFRIFFIISNSRSYRVKAFFLSIIIIEFLFLCYTSFYLILPTPHIVQGILLQQLRCRGTEGEAPAKAGKGKPPKEGSHLFLRWAPSVYGTEGWTA